jgi:cytochrome P450
VNPISADPPAGAQKVLVRSRRADKSSGARPLDTSACTVILCNQHAMPGSSAGGLDMAASAAVQDTPGDIATPRGSPGLAAKLLSSQQFPAAVARLGARLAALWEQPIRLGTKVLVVRHAQVMEVLTRDLDFLIAPVNEKRIDDVNGPFVLGMDRGVTLAAERGALYRALSDVDLTAVRDAVANRSTELVEQAEPELDVVGGYARPVAAETATALFGIAGPDRQTFKDVARAIFAHIFLNLSGDKAVEQRALRAAALMREWFLAEIARRRKSGDFGTDMMGSLLRDTTIDDDGVRRTLGGMLVGSIDTTASSVAKIVAMIGRDRHLAASIAADVADEQRLAGWCREALRRWPHNPILLRRAAARTTLADLEIREDDEIILWTQAAMLDQAVFPEPHKMRHDRPATAYLHFGGGLHPCAGRAVNAFQIPLLVGALVRRGIKSTGPVEWAGPFPDRLVVRFNR